MKVGLILIGDELLSGLRQDKHMPQVLQFLKARGLSLAWVRMVGDDWDLLVQTLRETFATKEMVFSFGFAFVQNSLRLSIVIQMLFHRFGKLIVLESTGVAGIQLFQLRGVELLRPSFAKFGGAELLADGFAKVAHLGKGIAVVRG